MRVAQHSHGTASPSHISFSHFCLLPQTTRQSQRGWDFSCQVWDWDWIHFWDSILWKRLKARDRSTKFWLLCERHLFFSQRKGQITHIASSSSAGNFNCLILAWETLHGELLMTVSLGRGQAHLGTWSALGAWWPLGTWWTLKHSKQNRLDHD